MRPSRPLHLRRNGAVVQHIYVIELDPSVWDSPHFRAIVRAKPEQPHGRPVYIGSSVHAPACRLAIHAGARRCTCGVTGVDVEKRAGSRFVGAHGVRVLPSLGHTLRGTGKEARAAEKRLAAELRRQGYAVYSR